MARRADTYRGARRNACIRGGMVWGENWYYHPSVVRLRPHADGERYRKKQIISLQQAQQARAVQREQLQRAIETTWMYSGPSAKISRGAPRARSSGRGT